jgi:hypothetical protein
MATEIGRSMQPLDLRPNLRSRANRGESACRAHEERAANPVGGRPFPIPCRVGCRQRPLLTELDAPRKLALMPGVRNSPTFLNTKRKKIVLPSVSPLFAVVV